MHSADKLAEMRTKLHVIQKVNYVHMVLVRADLQGEVGVSGPDGAVVEQPLDVVHHHAGLVGPGQG